MKYNSIINHIKEIYLLPLILLIFYPILISYYIDYELVDSRNILINLIWLPLFSIPYIIFQKRIIYTVTVSVFFVIGFLELSHWLVMKGPLSVTSLLVISNTNLQESIEFFDIKSTYRILLIIPYILVFVFALRKKYTFTYSKTKKYIITFVLCISVIFISETILNGRFIRKGAPQIVKVTYSFFDKISLFREASQKNEPKTITATCEYANNQTFVLIIGESCNRNHMSLYGYTRQTNPKLSKRNDINIYSNVISSYSNTLSSINSMLSESSVKHELVINKGIDIIDVFHSAGFKTFWLSNQSPIGIWDNMVTVLANKADATKFINTSSNSSFEATYVGSYDSRVLEPLQTALEDTASKKIIIVHLMGSHSSYAKRYPSEFNTFLADSKKERKIAEYDNSILYNDFIIDSIYTMLSVYSDANNNRTQALYVSDHGENVYDEGENLGHDYSKQIPNANIEVPCIYWSSNNHEKSYNTTPFSIENIFHTVIQLATINTPILEPSKALFSNEYDSLQARYLENGREYKEAK